MNTVDDHSQDKPKKRSRQANGRSSIFEGTDGKWHGYVTFVGPDGKRFRRHVQAATRQEVTYKVAAIERERQRMGGVAGRSGQMTVAEWSREWLGIVERQRAPRTVEYYESKLRNHAQLLMAMPITKVTGRDVNRLLLHIEQNSTVKNSVKTFYILRAMFNVAVKHEVIPRNPCDTASQSRDVQAEMDCYTPEQAARLLHYARAHARQPARWALAVSQGPRQGEVLGATWSHLDLDTGVLRIRQQSLWVRARHGCQMVKPDHTPKRCPQVIPGGWRLAELKTKSSIRDLHLPPTLVEMLREHRKRQAQDRLAAGAAWSDHDLIFCHPDGRPIDPKTDNRAWKELCAGAGLRPIRLHDARHTAATIALVSGIPDRVIMDFMGHSQVSQLTRYQHVLERSKREAADRMEQALWAEWACRGGFLPFSVILSANRPNRTP